MRQGITKYRRVGWAMLVMTLSIVGMAYAQDPGKGATSYSPVDIKEDFRSTTFPLRGIKDSPPYLHDDRLLTLEDTVEFFNLALQLKLTEQEKKDLVAFMRVL